MVGRLDYEELKRIPKKDRTRAEQSLIDKYEVNEERERLGPIRVGKKGIENPNSRIDQRRAKCGPDEELVDEYTRSDGVIVKEHCRKIPSDRTRPFGYRSDREMMDHVRTLREERDRRERQ